MRFGFSFTAEAPVEQLLALVTRAEELGYDHAWIHETPFLALDPYPVLGAMAQATRRIRLGCCVTNPVVRPPLQTVLLTATLQTLSNGRMDLGIGRGDVSAHAVGRSPATLADVADCITLLRRTTQEKQVDLPSHATPSRPVQWVPSTSIPVWMGTYGPRGLEMAGNTADGVILQFADMDLVSWAGEHIQRGARAAGRPLGQPGLMVATPVSLEGNVEEVRWFSRMVGDDLARILPSQGHGSLPGAWCSWCRNWRGVLPPLAGGAGSEAMDALVDEAGMRLALVGPPRHQVMRLHELQSVGVSAINLLLRSRQPYAAHLETIERYACDVIAQVRR